MVELVESQDFSLYKLYTFSFMLHIREPKEQTNNEVNQKNKIPMRTFELESSDRSSELALEQIA